jgi:hypothetical protein
MSMQFGISNTKRLTFDIKGLRSAQGEKLEEDLKTLAWLLRVVATAQAVGLNTSPEDLKIFLEKVPQDIESVWFEVRKDGRGDPMPMLGWG